MVPESSTTSAAPFSLLAANVDEVIGLDETATRLSPGRAEYWAELGGSYEWAGRQAEAHTQATGSGRGVRAFT